MKKVQIIFNKTIKRMYELPINTPNQKLRKVLGNWNMETLIKMGYARSA